MALQSMVFLYYYLFKNVRGCKKMKRDYRRGRSGSQRKINPSAVLSGLCGKKNIKWTLTKLPERLLTQR
jgi:hypothetical protein